MIRLGEARIHWVQEKISVEPPELFGIDPALLDRERARLAPDFYSPGDGRIRLSIHSWIVVVDGLTVLIDPCIGNHKDRPGRPFAHQLETPWLDRFKATGVAPEQVDIVICTHLHCDHCGWNTRLSDGRWVPTFANARYLFGSTEYHRWDPAGGGDPADSGVFLDSVLPVVEAGQADIVGDHHQLSASLEIAPAPGHTRGHSMVQIQSGTEKGVFAGDALHHPIEILYPHTGVRGFEDGAMGIATRLAILDHCAEQRALLMPAHFVHPHAAWVSRGRNGYDFELVRPV
ncbi:MAG: MBL fold metallo-hydrolase [Sphingomonas sp.]